MKFTAGTLLLTAVLLFLTSCRGDDDVPVPVGGGILTPFTESAETGNGGDGSGNFESEPILPLVNPGENYNILVLLDGNLDLEQSDEQVIIAIPLDDLEAPLEVMIASTNPIRNEYAIAWTRTLATRTLTGITMKAEDLTGNGRSDLVISGFDERGRHVTEIFAVPKNGELTDFTRVFSLSVAGNIDVITHDRSPGYWSGQAAGLPFHLVVQKTDPDSDNAMDILETDWEWDSRTFSFKQGETRSVRTQVIQEDRIARVYAGDEGPYEEYLTGAWYRETANGGPTVMVFFDPETRETMFYDGTVQEVFSWGKSHRTTAKKMYARIINAIIPAMWDNLTVSAEDWDTINLWRRNAPAWDGTYKRLDIQAGGAMAGGASFDSLMLDLPLTGVWKSSTGSELVFDLPGIEWHDGDEIRSGTASLFSLGDTRVLQIRFMKNNGSWQETLNWILEYREEGDTSRIIRSLSLTPADLRAGGIRQTGDAPLYYEQIELVSGAAEG